MLSSSSRKISPNSLLRIKNDPVENIAEFVAATEEIQVSRRERQTERERERETEISLPAHAYTQCHYLVYVILSLFCHA